jgi:hypothetical protein
VPEFAKYIEKIINIKVKTSDTLYRALQSQILSLNQVIKPAVMSYDNSTQAEQLLQFLTIGLRNQYNSQSSLFKSIVSQDNRLVPFYISVLTNTSTDLAPSIVQLQHILTGNSKNLCHDCGFIFNWGNDFKTHQRKGSCTSGPSPGFYTKVFLTLDKKTFMC